MSSSLLLLLRRSHHPLWVSCIVLLVGLRFYHNVHAFNIPLSTSYSSSLTSSSVSICTIRTSFHNNNIIQSKKSIGHLVVKLSSNSNNDDDWYSDFNPNEFVKPRSSYLSNDDNSNNNNNNNNNNGYNNNRRDRGERGGDRGERGGNYRGRSSNSGGGGGRRGDNNLVRYERDTSRDNSNIDVATIETFIQDRATARRDGNYDLADSIKQTLLQDYGVQLWDKDRTWRSGCSTSGSGRKRFDDRSNDRSNNDRFNGGGRERRGRKDVSTIDFGPNGHDYSVVPGSGPITSTLNEDEIHQMIAERLRNKLSRQFDKADQIQAELIAAGVYVHDGKKQWRADGEFFGDTNDDRNGQPGRERGSRASKSVYKQSASSDPDVELTSDDIVEIESLLLKRTKAKASRDYNAADTIRDELRTTFNVYIDDRLMEWSVNGNFGMTAKNDDTRFQAWSESQFSEGSDDDTTSDAIIDLLEQRDVARASRNFQNADVIRDQLLEEYNVVLNDRLREWSVGGNFGLPEKTSTKDKDRPFVRRNTNRGNLSPSEIETIEELVHERDIAKKNRDFTTADTIREQLEFDYNVKVDDKTREWMVLTDEYSLAPTSRGGPALDEETVSYIAMRLKERSAYKAERNFDEADAIRDELKEQYSVAIDDRNREFSVLVDEFSIVNNNNNSQRTNRRKSSNEYDYDDDNRYENNDDTPIERDDNARVFRRQSSTQYDNDDVSDDETKNDTTQTAVVADVVRQQVPDYQSLTVVQLKEKLREAGLPVSGNKAELISRLTIGSNVA